MASIIGRISELIISIIKNGQIDGSIDSAINPENLSFTMWGMTVGIMQLIKVKAALIKSRKGLTDKNILNNYLKIFENGIKKNDL